MVSWPEDLVAKSPDDWMTRRLDGQNTIWSEVWIARSLDSQKSEWPEVLMVYKTNPEKMM